MINFKAGQRFVSKTEPDLGLGVVAEVQGRTVKLLFPSVGEVRMYRTENPPLDRYVLSVGETAKSEKGVSFAIESVREENGVVVYVGRGGREMKESELNAKAISRPADLFNAMQKGNVCTGKQFDLRMRAMNGFCGWQSSPVRGMIGPRVDMIPHQFYLCYRACSGSALPRLMLSDEVGLGKTIEAGMIWHSLKNRGRLNRTLIIVTENLKHQWLVEMKRRFNHVFTLVDGGYIKGLFAGFEKDEDKPNPFLLTDNAICTFEFLIQQPALVLDLLKSEWDMTIIDEAHCLIKEEGFTSKEYAIASVVLNHSKGCLLLTGTPLRFQLQAHFHQLQLLDPNRFSDFAEFEKSHETYGKLVRDLSKLPTDPNHTMSWDDLKESVPKNSIIRPWLEQENSKQMTAGEWMRRIVDGLGTGSLVFRNTRKGVGGFMNRKLDAIPLEPNPTYREMVDMASRQNEDMSSDICENGLLCTSYSDGWAMDERVVWLKQFLAEHPKDKVLLICETNEVVLALKALLIDDLGEKGLAVFCEDENAYERATSHERHVRIRDQEAARFGRDDGANVLIASEIGSEGRNFQFAHHLVLFDLPLDAVVVEQRIGRLDRIGQEHDIIIHVPYVKGSAQEVMFRWYNDGLNAFEAPLMTGGELFFKYTDELLLAVTESEQFGEKFIKNTIPKVRKDCDQMRKAIEKGRDRLLEFNSRDPEKSAEIMEMVEKVDANPDLQDMVFESLMNRGLYVEPSIIPECYVITMGPQVEAGSIPGMPDAVSRGGSSGGGQVENSNSLGFADEGANANFDANGISMGSSKAAKVGGMEAYDEDKDDRSFNGASLVVTFNRKVAMMHDDVDFVSWEHPLAQGVVDEEVSIGHGTVACNIWKDSGLSGLMMQYNFAVELPTSVEWGVSDIAGPRYITVLVDANGNDQTAHVEKLKTASFKDVGVPVDNAAVQLTLRRFSEEGFAVARRTATALAKEYAEEAANAVENRSEQEYQRMHHVLMMRGKAGNSPELLQMRKNVQERKKVVANAQIRLDSIRLLVCR